jgi:hypothetical protein
MTSRRQGPHSDRPPSTLARWVPLLVGVAGLMLAVFPMASTGTPAPPAAPGAHAFSSGPLFAVNFTESTLPPGEEWYLAVGTQTWNSTTTYLTIEEPAGTYQYFANTTERANLTPELLVSTGSFQVVGHAISLVLNWSLGSSPPVASTSTSSAGGPGQFFILGGIGIVGLLTLLAVVGAARGHRRGRRPPPSAPPVPASETPPADEVAPPAPSPPSEGDPLRHML